MKTIIGCSNSQNEAEMLAKSLKYDFVKSVKREFPDGEMHIHLNKDVENSSEILIYQSMYPKPTESLFEVLLISDLVKDKSKNITLIAPWLAYSRQDKRWFSTESYSLKTVIKLLKTSGVKKIITVDAHFHRKPGRFKLYGMEFVTITAVKELISYVKQKLMSDFLIIGPDEGSNDLLDIVGGKVVFEKTKKCSACMLPAKECRCESEKKTYDISTELKMNIDEHNIVILDDIISSGKTILSAIEKLKNKHIIVCATHGFFFNDSLKVMNKLGVTVVTTDSIKSDASNINVNNLLIDFIK